MTEKILIIEDDPDIREGVRLLLSSEDYFVTEAGSGEEGLALLTEDTDLVILDVMLPGISGLKVCEKIRGKSNVPVLFLTARSQESDKLVGLMAGGDDYLPKPFSYAELLGRIKALLRRYRVYQGKDGAASVGSEEPKYITVCGIKINTRFNEVIRDGRQVDLPEIEYQMLLLMARHPHQIFSAQMLYETVWDEPYVHTCANTVMVHIRKLRMEVEKDPKNPQLITTIWGRGYRLEDRT